MFFNKYKKQILSVPYQSQNSDDVPQKWHDKACGIACVKMVIDFLNKKDRTTMSQLIDEGVAINGYSEHGWIHSSLSRLIQNHGIVSYPQEFKSVEVGFSNGVVFKESQYAKDFVTSGIEKMMSQIDKGLPTLASVSSGFNENKESHLILIIGYEKNDKDLNLFYHDPDCRDGVDRKKEKVPEEHFRKYWRKMGIFVE